MSNGKQNEGSEQSMNNPAATDRQQGADDSGTENPAGIGSSQKQDTGGAREEQRGMRTGKGTADIERGTAGAQPNDDSLSKDPVGAFKERP